MPRARAPSESDPVGIGFIGCGDIATLHADAVRATEGAKLVGLWNYKEEDVSAGGHAFTAAGRAAEWDCTRYASAEALCADALVEAVYVLTTCETHRVYVEMALRAGKHVMVEKPVGASVSEIEAMVALAEERGLVLMPAHNYIYEESVRRIRSMVDTAALGRVTLVSIFYNIHHPEAVAARCQGVIQQIMTHHAYTSLYLTGGERPVSVSCMKATINDGSVQKENLAALTYQMPSGALSILQCSFANDDHSADAWSFYIKVLGTHGSARYAYNDFVDNRKHIVHSHTYQAYVHTIRNECEHFVHECLGKGRAPLSTMADAATAMRLLAAAEASATDGVHVTL